jgi:nitrogen-specific signal transduction histidine kinase
MVFTDSGPGIPGEIRDRILTAFFTTKSHGLGLGLATAKRLVEAHQGEIQIECPRQAARGLPCSSPLYRPETTSRLP